MQVPSWLTQTSEPPSAPRPPGGGQFRGPSGPSQQLQDAYNYAFSQLSGMQPTNYADSIGQNTQQLMDMLNQQQEQYGQAAQQGLGYIEQGGQAQQQAIRDYIAMVQQQAGVGRGRLDELLSGGQQNLQAAVERGRAGQRDVASRIESLLSGTQGRVAGLAGETGQMAGDVSGQVQRAAQGFGFDAANVADPNELTSGVQEILRSQMAAQNAAQAARENIFGAVDYDATRQLQQQYQQQMAGLSDMENQGVFGGQQQMTQLEAQLAAQRYQHQMQLAAAQQQFGSTGMGITQQGQQGQLQAQQQYDDLLRQLAEQRIGMGLQAGSAGIGLPQGWM